jgi:hypothetical protein
MRDETVSMLEDFWSSELTQIFKEVIKKYPEGFTSDEIWQHVRDTESDIPTVFVASRIGAYMKSFKASGHIVKLKTFRLSKRNGSSPLPIYRSAEAVKNDAVPKED